VRQFLPAKCAVASTVSRCFLRTRSRSGGSARRDERRCRRKGVRRDGPVPEMRDRCGAAGQYSRRSAYHGSLEPNANILVLVREWSLHHGSALAPRFPKVDWYCRWSTVAGRGLQGPTYHTSTNCLLHFLADPCTKDLSTFGPIRLLGSLRRQKRRSKGFNGASSQ